MRIRYNVVVVSAVLLSIGLLLHIPPSLHWASTWRDLNIDFSCIRIQNFFTPLGFFSLGLEMIGLIILWTGYRRRERHAWFVMLIITMFFIFPLDCLTLLLQIRAKIYTWSDLLGGVRAGWWRIIWIVEGFVNVLMMTIALLLPIRSFFGRTVIPTQGKAAAE